MTARVGRYALALALVGVFEVVKVYALEISSVKPTAPNEARAMDAVADFVAILDEPDTVNAKQAGLSPVHSVGFSHSVAGTHNKWVRVTGRQNEVFSGGDRVPIQKLQNLPRRRIANERLKRHRKLRDYCITFAGIGDGDSRIPWRVGIPWLKRDSAQDQSWAMRREELPLNLLALLPRDPEQPESTNGKDTGESHEPSRIARNSILSGWLLRVGLWLNIGCRGFWLGLLGTAGALGILKWMGNGVGRRL